MCLATTTDVLEQFEQVVSLDNVTTETLGDLLGKRYSQFTDDDNYIACHIALVKANRAEVGFLFVGMRKKWPPGLYDRGGWIFFPDGINVGTSLGLLTREINAAHFAAVSTPDQLAHLMRTMVEEAIANDTQNALNSGERPSIGGTPGVAVVTEAEARPWP